MNPIKPISATRRLSMSASTRNSTSSTTASSFAASTSLPPSPGHIPLKPKLTTYVHNFIPQKGFIYTGSISNGKPDGSGALICCEKKAQSINIQTSNLEQVSLLRCINLQKNTSLPMLDLTNVAPTYVHFSGLPLTNIYFKNEFSNDEFTYIGGFKEGKRHGYGALIRKDGVIFIGKFKEGILGLGDFVFMRNATIAGEALWENTSLQCEGQNKYEQNTKNLKEREEVNKLVAYAKKKTKEVYLEIQGKIYQNYLNTTNDLLPEINNLIGQYAAPNWIVDGKQWDIESAVQTKNFMPVKKSIFQRFITKVFSHFSCLSLEKSFIVNEAAPAIPDSTLIITAMSLLDEEEENENKETYTTGN